MAASRVGAYHVRLPSTEQGRAPTSRAGDPPGAPRSLAAQPRGVKHKQFGAHQSTGRPAGGSLQDRRERGKSLGKEPREAEARRPRPYLDKKAE